MRAGATVVDLRKRRIERLADELARDLLQGHVIVDVDQIDSVDEWRAAARVAARRRNWKVRTGMSRGNGRVFAVRVDPEAERGRTGWS
ncbi:MAG: hypothetical protein H0V75_10845 [Rubrobacter sp.]|nr:hypothetical protein [Rubrobacter sp.]